MSHSLRLYGSLTSPFVRRLRLLMDPSSYDFVNLDIYGPDRARLREISPVLKIPVLEDGEMRIFDSRVIQRYLADKGHVEKLPWAKENTLTVIDGVSDSLVNVLLLKRSGVVLEPTSVLGKSHSERVKDSLALLETQVQENYFSDWDFLSQSLYSMLDWCLFRELADLSACPHLLRFVANHKTQVRVRETDPRNA
jgi:glutathione S-transferase